VRSLLGEPSLKLAVDNLRRAIDINGNDASLHFLVANAFNRAFSIKRYGLSDADRTRLDQTILEELTKALTLDPDLLPALGQRAQVYFDLKQFAQAVPDYDKIVALDPKNAGAYNDRGWQRSNLVILTELSQILEWRWRTRNVCSSKLAL
jgi:tetratricopeptide (TPR) repeat protein